MISISPADRNTPVHAEIISVGTEIVLGSVLDTNASFLARALASLGISVSRVTAVPDEPASIREALAESWGRSDLLVVTGGLGPTDDDMTREVLAELVDEELVLDEGVMEGIQRKLKGRRIPKGAIRKQAMFLPSAKKIANPLGTAPGIVLEKNNRTMILLPGVPREMKKMVEEGVYPYLLSCLDSRQWIVSRSLKVWGMGESEINERIGDLMKQTSPRVGLLAKRGGVEITITAASPTRAASEAMRGVEAEIERRLGRYVWGRGSETMEEVVGRLLTERALTVAVAESCTGGLLAHRLTNIPGSSDYFLCGITSYSNQAKTALLEVPASVVRKVGAVSCQAARLMARGAKARGSADLGVSTTGIAGPGGGTQRKPVGLVYVGLSSQGGETAEKFYFTGGREDIKWRSSQAALDILRRHILEDKPKNT